MRERRGYTRRVFRVLRITPAYAGKTKSPAGFVKLHEDHPRVCGKYARSALKDSGLRGSPPRMREIQVRVITQNPAAMDHPRVCGKYPYSFLHFYALWGSPPRMQERQSVKRTLMAEQGITPAYAGKTHLAPPSTQQGRDHPRVCGKYCCNNFVLSLLVGSPPRMREILKRTPALNSSLRITPAYAGNTSGCGVCQLPCGDHPRVCGKY